MAQDLLASPKRAAVVRFVVRHPNRSWTGRQLAREVGVSPRWAIETLQALEAEGVVHPRNVPPAVLWTVNQRHVLLRVLKGLTRLDDSVREMYLADLRKAVAPSRPLAAILFGSVARGDERATSDVDLLVVVRLARDRTKVLMSVIEHGSAFFWRYGNRLAPIVITEREFRGGRAYGVVGEALREGVWIWGKPANG